MLPAAAIVVAGSLLLAATVVPLLTGYLAASAGRRQLAARAALTSELVEAIDGGAELAVAGRGADRVGGSTRPAAGSPASPVAMPWPVACATALGSLLGGLAVIAVLLVAIPAVHHGALAGVLLAALVFLVLAAFEGIAPLPVAARRLRACADAAQRLEELCGARARGHRSREPLPAPHARRRRAGRREDPLPLRRGDPWLLDGAELTPGPGLPGRDRGPERRRQDDPRPPARPVHRPGRGSVSRSAGRTCAR